MDGNRSHLDTQRAIQRLVGPPITLPDDVIVHAEWSFMRKMVNYKCTEVQVNSQCHKTHVVSAERCICDWIKDKYELPCPSILMLENGENFGVMDPSPSIYYPKQKNYEGCETWKLDAQRFAQWLDHPNVIRVFYRQTPPVEHSKIEIVPLGVTQAFMAAWKASKRIPTPLRTRIYYVNHSPWRHRESIFNTVNKHWNQSLKNEFCSKTYGCHRGRMSDVKYLQRLRSSFFVESPPGMGEDCYRHYEVMLAGAIPVVQKSLSYAVFGDLPHLPITDWNTVTPTLLENFAATFDRGHVSFNRLRKRFWVNRVKALAQSKGVPQN